MKHFYNLSSAANTLQSATSALGTAISGKLFTLLLLSFLILISGRIDAQTTTLYGTNRFNTLDNLYIQTVSGRIELALGGGQLRAYTSTGSNAYNGYVAISNRTFNLRRGYTYTVSFSARALDHNQGGPGDITVLRGGASNIDWNSNDASALGSTVVAKTAGTGMTTYTISIKPNVTINTQYLALKIATTGGNQSELYLDNLRIVESCAPDAPQATSNGSCSINVPILLTASGATAGIEEYRWYTSETGTTPIAGVTGPQYTTPSLGETQTYYVAIYNTETACFSTRVPVTASVGGLITPTVRMTTGSCDSNGNETKIYTASGGSEGNYRWYSVATDGTFTMLNGSNNQPITSSTLSRRTNSDGGNYAVTVMGAGCESGAAYFSVSQGYPLPPSNNATGAICGTQLILRANGASLGESYNWYATADGETSFIGQGAILTTTAPTISTVYTVSKINVASGCESPTRRTATLSTSPILQNSVITGNATVCQGSSVTYSVPNVSGATYVWAITAATGSTGATISSGAGTSQITILYPNSTYRGTLRVTVTNPCNSYVSELEVQASNNNAAIGEIIMPDNLELGQPAVFKFTTPVPLDLSSQYQWYTRKPKSSTWERIATTRDLNIQAMPGDIDALKVDILVSENNQCFVLGSTETFGAMSFSISNEAIVPLPVELISFNAKKETKGVVLTWATASELDNKGFEVQVSTDARKFTALGFVESKVGTTSLRQDYKFLDTKAVSGTRYYRLKQIDLDGTTSFSPVKAVVLNEGNSKVSAYPNPFDDAVVVTLNGTEARNVKVMLMDAMGKVIQQRTEETSGNSITVDMRSIRTKGMYVLHVYDNDTKHTFKLMKR